MSAPNEESAPTATTKPLSNPSVVLEAKKDESAAEASRPPNADTEMSAPVVAFLEAATARHGENIEPGVLWDALAAWKDPVSDWMREFAHEQGHAFDDGEGLSPATASESPPVLRSRATRAVINAANDRAHSTGRSLELSDLLVSMVDSPDVWPVLTARGVAPIQWRIASRLRNVLRLPEQSEAWSAEAETLLRELEGERLPAQAIKRFAFSRSNRRILAILRGTSGVDARLLTTRDLVAATLIAAESESETAPAWLRGQVPLDGARLRQLLAEGRDPVVARDAEFPLTDADNVTVELWSTVALAAELASATTPSEARDIHARHLLAATLIVDPGKPTLGQQLLSEAGLSVEELRGRFATWLTGLSLADNYLVWENSLRREPTLAHPDFSADAPDGTDALGVTREARALAALATAWEVAPPLAIGLFGAWGTGKSFFVRKMKSEVGRLSKLARASTKTQRALGRCKNVVQIEFNAWHYAEANLWAALLDHILQNLRFSDEEAPSIVKARQDALLTQLLTVRDRAKERAAQKTETEERIKQLKKKSEEEKKKREREIVLRSALHEGFVALKDIAPEVGDKIEKIQAATGLRVPERLDELRSTVTRMRNPLTALGTSIRLAVAKRRNALIVSVIAAVIGLALYAVYRWIAQSAFFVGLFSPAFLLSLLPMVRQVQSANKKFRELLKEAEEKATTELAGTEQDLAKLRTESDRLQREVEELESEERRLASTLEGTTADSMLREFLADRLASDDYRKHLGLSAIIRRDFQTLTNLFGATREKQEHGDDGDSTSIHRIVLYIDDLDRCKPEQVVEVLRAVHLLLAYPLFVVVVAVDARWVTTCLEWQHASSLAHEHAPVSHEAGSKATAADYLEKIFQIPFWLRPVNGAGSRALLTELLEPKSGSAPHEPPSGSPPVEPLERRDPDRVRASPLGNAPRSNPNARPNLQIPQAQASRLDLSNIATVARRMEVSQDERRYILRLGRLLDRSPRIIKRFANTYRLHRALLDDAGLAELVRKKDQGQYKPFALVLALMIGHPELAHCLFPRVRSWSGDVLWTDALDGWRSDFGEFDGWEAWEERFRELGESPRRDLRRDLKASVRAALRYSFYRDDPVEAPPELQQRPPVRSILRRRRHGPSA